MLYDNIKEIKVVFSDGDICNLTFTVDTGEVFHNDIWDVSIEGRNKKVLRQLAELFIDKEKTRQATISQMLLEASKP